MSEYRYSGSMSLAMFEQLESEANRKLADAERAVVLARAERDETVERAKFAERERDDNLLKGGDVNCSEIERHGCGACNECLRRERDGLRVALGRATTALRELHTAAGVTANHKILDRLPDVYRPLVQVLNGNVVRAVLADPDSAAAGEVHVAERAVIDAAKKFRASSVDVLRPELDLFAAVDALAKVVARRGQ